MLKNILILGFRADVGSYVVYSYPKFDAANSNLDVMNIYNLHRFRTTERNFQLIQQGGFNIASYYSGFKNTNYIGQPDYCVTLLLGAGENPNEYERPLMKVTNNLLADLGGSGFEELLSDTYVLIDNKQFDEIKISRRGGAALGEAPLEHKAIATTLGLTDASFLIIAALISFLLVYVLYISIKISEMSDRIQELISYTSILENKIRKSDNKDYQ